MANCKRSWFANGWLLVVALSLFGMSKGALAAVVINEVDYDQPGSDTAEYIELFNNGPSAVDLNGYSLVLVNGANGGSAIYKTITLPSFSLSAGGYYVVCADPAATANCQLDVSPNSDLIQNGAPDAMALLFNGAIVDALSYEGNVPGYTEVSGAPTDTAASSESLSRCPNGVDMNNNSLDFQLRPTTPGAANNCGGGGGPTGQCGDAATAISAVQGSGLTSPLAGQTVEIVGVVTLLTPGLNGFFVQQEDGTQDADPLTSEGVFVYTGSTAVTAVVGNVVRVRGDVTEFDTITELGNATVTVCEALGAVAPTAVSLPVVNVSDWESYEGMLVQFAQTLTVTGNYELGRYGSLDLSSEGRLFVPTHSATPGPAAVALAAAHARQRLVLDDGASGQNPNPIPYTDANLSRRVGDTLDSLAGVIDGRFGSYRIHPRSTPVFASANVRPAATPNTGGRLRVSTFNVLNFFTTLDTGSPACGPLGTLDCRGANNTTEFNRQREKLLNALELLGADVFGLIELENNSSASLQSIVDGLNARLGAGTYAFVNTGTIGTDAIKVGFIYKPATVLPSGGFAVLSSAVDPAFLDTKNRPVLAQTFSEVSTQQQLTLAVAHLKSKGSACDDVGDPDALDGQGNCNLTRAAAAQALADWLSSDPTSSGDPDFLVMGDLNAYRLEDPITTLQANGFESLLEAFIGPGAYSYQFGGESGYLDHALATASLVTQVTDVAEWHGNADEPIILDYNTEFKTQDPFNINDPFRASDHDPVVIGLDLGGSSPVPTPVLDTRGLLGLFLALSGFGASVLLGRRTTSA